MLGPTLVFGLCWKKQMSQTIMLDKRSCYLSHCKHLWNKKQGTLNLSVQKYGEKTFIFSIIYKFVLPICFFNHLLFTKGGATCKQVFLIRSVNNIDLCMLTTVMERKNLKICLSSKKAEAVSPPIKVFHFITLLFPKTIFFFLLRDNFGQLAKLIIIIYSVKGKQ